MPADTFKSLAAPGMYNWMRANVFGGANGYSVRKNLIKSGVAVK
jgi:hypothetical protein